MLISLNLWINTHIKIWFIYHSFLIKGESPIEICYISRFGDGIAISFSLTESSYSSSKITPLGPFSSYLDLSLELSSVLTLLILESSYSVLSSIFSFWLASFYSWVLSTVGLFSSLSEALSFSFVRLSFWSSTLALSPSSELFLSSS